MSYRSDTQLAYDYFSRNDLIGASRALAKQIPTARMTDLRGIAWRLLNAELSPKSYSLGSHDGPATGCVVYPDGNTVATVGEDGLVRVWDIAWRRMLKSFAPMIGPVHAIAISPDGKTLALGGKPILATLDKALVYLLDSKTGMRKGTVHNHATTIESIRFSPDGRLIAAGSRYEPVQLSTIDGKKLTSFSSDSRNGLIAFSPDSKLLATSVRKTEVYIWDCETGEHIDDVGLPGAIGSINWSSIGDYFVVSEKFGPKIVVFDAEDREPLDFLQFSTQDAHAVAVIAISGDGQAITAGDADGKLIVWQASPLSWRSDIEKFGKRAYSRPIAEPFAIDNERFTSIVLLNNGSIVTTHSDGNVIVSNPLQTAAEIHSIEFDVTAVAAAADESVYLGSSDGAVHRFSLNTGAHRPFFLQLVWRLLIWQLAVI